VLSCGLAQLAAEAAIGCAVARGGGGCEFFTIPEAMCSLSRHVVCFSEHHEVSGGLTAKGVAVQIPVRLATLQFSGHCSCVQLCIINLMYIAETL
jgi:hypothetical protein